MAWKPAYRQNLLPILCTTVWAKNDKTPQDFIAFRKQLAKAMIYNEYLQPSPEERVRTPSSTHCLQLG